jgi:hypothetical protein
VAERLADGSWEVQGQRVTFPVRIADAGVAAAVYAVPAARAQVLLASTPLTPVTVAGRVLVVLALIDYRVNDLGTYDEVALAVLARSPDGAVGAYVAELPVTAAFTLEAGRAIWGLPKWLASVQLRIGRGRAECQLAEGEERVLTASMRTSPGRLPFPLRRWLTVLAVDGAGVLATRICVRLDGVSFRPGGTRLQLRAGHRMAEALTGLGLRRALLTVVVERGSMELRPARRVLGSRSDRA